MSDKKIPRVGESLLYKNVFVILGSSHGMTEFFPENSVYFTGLLFIEFFGWETGDCVSVLCV